MLRRPLPRYHARSTARVRIPVSSFHARSSYSYQHCFYALRGSVTRLFLRSRAKLVSTLLSRCTREGCRKDASVLSHTKSVSTLAFRWTHEERHKIAPALSREKLVSRPFSRYKDRFGRRQSFSSNNHDEKTYTSCNAQPGRRRIGFSGWHGEMVSSR